MKTKIIIEKNIYGYLVLSAIVKNQLITRRYDGYTKKAAISEFKNVLKNI